jgi:hypothetical protein
MLTISNLIKSTPPSVKEKVGEVVVKPKKAVNKEGSSLYVFTAATKKVPGKKQARYETMTLLKGVPKTKVAFAKSEAWVSCTCPFFKFHCEVALTKKGSSTIIHTKGYKPPKVAKRPPVNPRNIPYVCKHLLASFLVIPKIRSKEGTIPLKTEIQKALVDIRKYIP